MLCVGKGAFCEYDGLVFVFQNKALSFGILLLLDLSFTRSEGAGRLSSFWAPHGRLSCPLELCWRDRVKARTPLSIKGRDQGGCSLRPGTPPSHPWRHPLARPLLSATANQQRAPSSTIPSAAPPRSSASRDDQDPNTFNLACESWSRQADQRARLGQLFCLRCGW